MADIEKIKSAIPSNKGTVNDIAVRDVDTHTQGNKKMAYLMLKAAVRLGIGYKSAGAPSGTDPRPFSCGAMCLDTTNDDIYVCSDRSTPTWTKLAE